MSKSNISKLGLRSALLLGAAFAAIAPSSGMAQDRPASGAAASEIGEVIVTARRREERLQEVPIAVTALTGEELARQSVNTLSDLTTKVPSFQMSPTAYGNNVPRFTIRGQSQFEALQTLDPSVAVYFADVVISRAQGVNGALYDLQSVQVLKGPQGTLFGRNSTGGAVLIVPRDPAAEFGGYINAEAGNYDLRSIEAAINLPINDKLQLRLSGRSYSHRGYTPDALTHIDWDDANNQSVRIGLKWTPTDNITNTTFITGFHAKENGLAQKGVSARPEILARFAQGAAAAAQYAAMKNDPYHSVRTDNPANGTFVRTFGAANTTVFELNDNISIKNIAGYRKLKSNNYNDNDGTGLTIFPTYEFMKNESYSDELQFIAKFGERVDLIVGGYAFHERGLEGNLNQVLYAPLVTQVAPGYSIVNNDSQSIYGQAVYHVPGIEGLSITAGARYTWDQRDFFRVALNNGNCALSTTNTPGGAPRVPCQNYVKYKNSEPTYTLGVDWQVTSDKLVYFVTRRGYRSGGFNSRASVPFQFTPFQPETVTDYEAGLKADWNDMGVGRLRTNIAVYYQDYKDIQRTQFAALTPTFLVTNVLNAAQGKVKGTEIDINWSPAPWLELRGYYALADSKYTKWQIPISGGGFTDRSGFRFANTPKNSGGGTVRVIHDLGETGELTAAVDVYAQSGIVMNDDNTPEAFLPGYHFFNARFEWLRAMDSKVNLAVWVRNFTNEKYAIGGISVAGAGLAFTTHNIGAPRTFGVSVGYEF